MQRAISGLVCLQIGAKQFGMSVLASQHGGSASEKAILSSEGANPAVWDVDIIVAPASQFHLYLCSF